MLVSIASPLTQPSPYGRQVGFRIVTFEAFSGFTHVTAHRIARPPKATFVTRLQPFRLPGRAARQLPDQSTSFWVDSSSTSDSRLRGALPGKDIDGSQGPPHEQQVWSPVSGVNLPRSGHALLVWPTADCCNPRAINRIETTKTSHARPNMRHFSNTSSKTTRERNGEPCSPSEVEAAFRSVTLKEPETARHQDLWSCRRSCRRSL